MDPASATASTVTLTAAEVEIVDFTDPPLPFSSTAPLDDATAVLQGANIVTTLDEDIGAGSFALSHTDLHGHRRPFGTARQTERTRDGALQGV